MTLTARGMTRFIMSIEQAVQLVVDSAHLAQGGEVFVTKMPVIRIQDLAEVMIQELAPKYGKVPGEINIEIVGSKPGEKQYEELMTLEEVRRAVDLPRYFAVRPAFSSLYGEIDYLYPEVVHGEVEKPYHSGNEEALDKEALRQFLYENALLEGEPEETFQPDRRYWGDEKAR